MKQYITRHFQLAFLLLMLLSFTGCEIIQEIFAAGFWAGIILAVLLVIFIWFIVRKMKRK